MLAHALQVGERCVVVMGSAHQAPSPKNPFDWQTRARMVLQSLSEADAARVDILPLRDYYDGDRWASALRHGVAGFTPPGGEVALISHYKDMSSAYLNWFPEWQTAAFPRQNDVDATPIREALFAALSQDPTGQRAAACINAGLPTGTRHVLSEWITSPEAHHVAREWAVLQAEQKAWSVAPYPPILVTVDAVIVCMGHVLLVERGRMPGEGLLAVPGGFLDPHERIDDAALRELQEETGLSLSAVDARNTLKASRVFDHPTRSQRGRVVTHAYHFELPATQLPDVQGADDARSARWIPIADLTRMENRFFDDHFHILDSFLGLLPR